MMAVRSPRPEVPVAAGTRKVVMLGASAAPICGVRDYSRRLGGALEELGVEVSDVWWEIDQESKVAYRRRALESWLESLIRVVHSERPSWVFWHYSVFTYSYRGIPTLVFPVTSCLSRIPVGRVGFLHEFAYPFGRRGFKGAVLASTHRAALARLYRILDAAIVTTEHRQAWLENRKWLPYRPSRFLPVFSNVPDVEPAAERAAGSDALIGIFGFGAETFQVDPVVGALARLRRGDVRPELLLIGAPGPESRQATKWREAAIREGCADALLFTGILEPAALGRALGDVDVIVLPDPIGPSGRRSTLAAALAAHKPVVAFDGPRRWNALVEDGAVVITKPDADRLAHVLEWFLRDPRARLAQGERAGAFYRSHQAPEVIAPKLLDFLDSIPEPMATRTRGGSAS